MTRVVGKAPIALSFSQKVSLVDADRIRISSGGWLKQRFETYSDLSPHAAKLLILELRKALRSIRDERVAYFNTQVSEAEKLL